MRRHICRSKRRSPEFPPTERVGLANSGRCQARCLLWDRPKTDFKRTSGFGALRTFRPSLPEADTAERGARILQDAANTPLKPRKKRAEIDFLPGESQPQGVHAFLRADRNPPRIKSGAFARKCYSAACRTWRAFGVRIVTSSSAAVGCSAIVASKSALVAFILTAMPSNCTISAAPSPTM
jgi:hypothetical protein